MRGTGLPLRSTVIANPGWRAVFSRKEDREKDEPERDEGTASFTEGEEIPVMGHGLSQKKTLPKPLYTEATLLTAMENCGKEITDGQAREAVKDTGIGTPATRAAIITTLLKRDYIERSGKNIRPTEKGLYLYESVKDMMVADAKLTGTWEKALEQIEGRTLDPETSCSPSGNTREKLPARYCVSNFRSRHHASLPAPSARPATWW